VSESRIPSMAPTFSHGRPFLVGAAYLAAAVLAAADPLSKKTEIDFYRDVLSREMHGLATRSDGRLVAGPALTDLKGASPSELLWCVEPAPGSKGRWLVGTGPGGQIFEVSVSGDGSSFTSTLLVKLGEPQVYALKALPEGSILAGTSAGGGLYLVRGGKVAARVGLPAESVFDFVLLDGGKAALASTGNPGRIYRIDLARFAGAGVSAGRTTEEKALAAKGVTLFGEAGDRNLRRIVRLSDGRIAAGSAPKGNLYLFGPEGGAPFIAQENHDAEVTDLLPDDKGGYYAAVVFSGGEIHPVTTSIQVSGPTEITVTPAGAPPVPAPTPAPNLHPGENPSEILNAPIQAERFPGRSSLQWFSPEGFPETLLSRSGVAFYRMGRAGDLLLISGGEQGEMSGFDLTLRLSLTFAGSGSSQVNDLEPVPGAPGRFFAIRNNAPGFSVVDFGAAAPRTAQTKRVDLGSQGRLGALRFNRLRDVDPGQLSISIRTTNAANETDGWSPWVPMTDADGWRANVPTGRYVELKLALPAASKPTLELDRASISYLGQNHRPQLVDFRMLSPNFAIVVPPEMPAPVVTTVGQLIQSSGDREGERRRTGFMGSQIVASPGTRVAFWTVNDPDGDNLLYTFSIRHEGEDRWTDIAIDSKESYVQFDTLHLQEGTWFTRLLARETAPRLEADRLSVTFETDDMVVDHTAPVIEEATARRQAGKLVVTLRGRDALSLLDSAEFDFNNGVHETVEQPVDGILDGKEETFSLDLPLERVAGATSVEVTLYDSAGNGATRRLDF
jgi:hypothetical protein